MPEQFTLTPPPTSKPKKPKRQEMAVDVEYLIKRFIFFIKNTNNIIGYKEETSFAQSLILPLKNKYNIDVNKIGKKIGSGTQGSAYEYGPNKVLKLTRDISETKTMATFIGNFSKYVVKVYRSFLFPVVMLDKKKNIQYELSSDSKQATSKHKMGWILMERLPEEVGQEIDDFLLEISEELIYSYMDLPHTVKRDQRLFQEIQVAADVYDVAPKDAKRIAKLCIDLKKRGIYFIDFVWSNLMRNSKGNIVLIDIGYSESRQAKKPEEIKLERLLKQLYNNA